MTERTLQRYCDKQHLDGQKRITGEGEKWFVRKSSVSRRIKELAEFDALRASRQAATSDDLSVPVTEVNKEDLEGDKLRQEAAENVSSPVGSAQVSHPTSDDLSRQAATGRDVSAGNETSEHTNARALTAAERELYERMVGLLEEQREDLMKDKELLQSDKEALLRQLEAKDKQIERFFESERDTKTLAGRLQSLMSSLWPKEQREIGERYVPANDALESGLPREEGEGRRPIHSGHMERFTRAVILFTTSRMRQNRGGWGIWTSNTPTHRRTASRSARSRPASCSRIA